MEKYLESTRLIFDDFKEESVEKKNANDVYQFLSNSKAFMNMSKEMSKEFGDGNDNDNDNVIMRSSYNSIELIYQDGSIVTYCKEEKEFQVSCEKGDIKKSFAYPRYISMKEFNRLAKQANLKAF